jgi:hypothetical protein
VSNEGRVNEVTKEAKVVSNKVRANGETKEAKVVQMEPEV